MVKWIDVLVNTVRLSASRASRDALLTLETGLEWIWWLTGEDTHGVTAGRAGILPGILPASQERVLLCCSERKTQMAEKPKTETPVDKDALRRVLKSQYHAAASMLREAVERCPDELWTSTAHPNPFWHIAYHALFYMHLYLQPSEADFKPWEKHREEYQYMGRLPSPPHRPPKIAQPYSKAEVMEYARFCISMIGPAVDRLDLYLPESGFSWYKMSKLEHQIVSIRHIQHHAAQLVDRLGQTGAGEFNWAGGRPID